MIIENIIEAKKYLYRLFQEKKGAFSVDSITEGMRQEHFEIYSTNDIYYCLFKRDFFFKFGEIFSKKGLKGAGESINTDVLAYILKWAIDWILFIYPDGKIYKIDPKKFQEFVQEYNTIRSTGYNELTASVPLKLLERLWGD